MARLWTCGFELNSVTGGEEFDALVSSGTNLSTTRPRSGTYGLRGNTTGSNIGYIRHQVRSGASSNTLFARIYVNIERMPTGSITLVDFLTGTSTDIGWVTIESDGTLVLRNSAGTQVGSASSALVVDTWYMVELSANESTGAIAARLDGTQFASGTDTSGVTGLHTVWIGLIDVGDAEIFFDDVAINDSSGSVQNSWPGQGKVVHLKPNAAGDFAEGIIVGGTPTAWEAVDEINPDDATTYYNLSDNNDDLSVNLESSATAGIGASDTITLVQVGHRHARATAASSTHNVYIKSQASGTLNNGSAVTSTSTSWNSHVAATPRIPSLTAYTEPQSGGAWTPALLDTTQIGAIATDAAPDVWISTLWLTVEYVPAAGSASSSVSPSPSASVSPSSSVSPSPSASVSPSSSVSPSPSLSLSISISLSPSSSLSASPSVSVSPSLEIPRAYVVNINQAVNRSRTY